MTIANQDVKIYRGNTTVLAVAVTMADGTAFDPSLQVAIRWRLARNWHSPDTEVLVRKQLGAGIELITGGVAITLASASIIMS